MEQEVTSAFRDLRDTLLDEMRVGFSGVYARQDKTNGRLLDVEEVSTRHDERIRTLFRLREQRKGDKGERGERGERGEDSRVSMRDVRMVIAGIMGTIAVLAFFFKVLPFVIKALAP